MSSNVTVRRSSRAPGATRTNRPCDLWAWDKRTAFRRVRASTAASSVSTCCKPRSISAFLKN
eukprot:2592602-Alexandrium_andersonii.AAC.1